MFKAMVFIDYENFNISKNMYYKSLIENNVRNEYPKIDYYKMCYQLVNLIKPKHSLMQVFVFIPKPDEFLMQDEQRKRTYDWLSKINEWNYFTVIEGSHIARPTAPHRYNTMDINDASTYYIAEKGTDVNLTANLITKGFMNAFDTAIILSSDTDYIPAIKILNTIGKSVAVAGIKTQSLNKFKAHTVAQFLLDETFFDGCLKVD